MAELWTSAPENDFIASMKSARTFGAMDNAVRHLTVEQAYELRDALRICRRYDRGTMWDRVLIDALYRYIHKKERERRQAGYWAR